MKLRLYKFLPATMVEGPGKRACIWVQGCSICCKGCALPQTWDQNNGCEITVDELAGKILEDESLEGVTFMGGEPFLQAEALMMLGTILKKEGLSILTFTGFMLEDIVKQGKENWRELLAVTDLLIDGPYIEELSDISRPWVGSLNQSYHFLTERYRYLESTLYNIPNRLEIRISKDGSVFINGMIREQDLKALSTIL